MPMLWAGALVDVPTYSCKNRVKTWWPFHCFQKQLTHYKYWLTNYDNYSTNYCKQHLNDAQTKVLGLIKAHCHLNTKHRWLRYTVSRTTFQPIIYTPSSLCMFTHSIITFLWDHFILPTPNLQSISNFHWINEQKTTTMMDYRLMYCQ